MLAAHYCSFAVHIQTSSGNLNAISNALGRLNLQTTDSFTKRFDRVAVNKLAWCWT